ncbi:MAG: ABC transporter ATP-binding protein [Methylococcales bacterium]
MTGEKQGLIEVRNVTFSYSINAGLFRNSVHTPLKDISFALYRGQTTGIIGRNGVGKSTLLRLIAGILEPDSGSIKKGDAVVSLLSLGLGFVQHLSGRQNAMLSGILLGLRRKEIARKMDSIIEFSGLGEFIDRPLHTYSSGMRARLGFSVAIQVDPDVLLIDEILGVGDEEFRVKSTTEMKRLIKSDKTVVMVSHNLPLLRELCDNLIWIDNGVIEQEGPPSGVLERYIARYAPGKRA